MQSEEAFQGIVKAELDGVAFGDARRSRRAVTIAERLASNPSSSLPDAMGTRADAEALYRHLSSSQVTSEAILQPHMARTVERVEAESTVFAVSDTTEFQFGGETLRNGLGPINTKAQGFLAHVVLAVSSDGSRRPLGLLDVNVWARRELKNIRRRKQNTQSRNDPGRESLKWERGMWTARNKTFRTSLIHVADRDGDMYDLLVHLTEQRERFIIRAAQNRALVSAVDGVQERLLETVRALPTMYQTDVPVGSRPDDKNRPAALKKKHPKRGCRTARLSFSSKVVRLRRPEQCASALPAALELTVVHVIERTPPAGEQPVEWTLLTSERASTPQEVAFVVNGYRTRWVVEEFFKAIKTGCAFESRQLESFWTLSNLFAYVLVIAYSMLVLRSTLQQGKREPASSVVTPLQLKVLRGCPESALKSKPSARDVLMAIAGLGGHLKSNGDPGWQVLSRGWRKLLEYERGFKIAISLGRCDQS